MGSESQPKSPVWGTKPKVISGGRLGSGSNVCETV